MGMTPQHPTSCAFQVANYTHHKTLYMHLAYSYALSEQGARHCLLHSLISILSTIFSSNKISQHNLNSNIPYRPYTYHTYHTDPALLMDSTPQFLHTGKTDHICDAQYSNYIVHCSHSQHNTLINMHSQHYPPHYLPQPSTHNQNTHKAYLCKQRQNNTRCRDGV